MRFDPSIVERVGTWLLGARDSHFRVVPATILVPSVTDTIPIHLGWGECFQRGQPQARTRTRRLSRHSAWKWDPDDRWYRDGAHSPVWWGMDPLALTTLQMLTLPLWVRKNLWARGGMNPSHKHGGRDRRIGTWGRCG